MGGVDKGWIDLHGKPLIEHVIARFAPQVDELLISANRSLERYRALGYPVVEDDPAEFAGPLAGLHAAIAHAKFDLIATVPCDGPLLPLDLVARLRQALSEADADIAVARAGERIHPVYALFHRRDFTALGAFMQAGGRRQMAWIESRPHVIVDFADASAFGNLNEPGDLASF